MFTPDEILCTLLKIHTGLFGGAEIHGHYPLPKGPKIIAANHTLASDPFHLPLVLEEKPYFMIQHKFFDLPIVGSLLKQAGQIPVKRNSAEAKNCLKQASQALAEGKTIIIFPEGKLVPPDMRVPAKTGTIRLALETGAPIIPLGMYVAPQHVVDLSINWRNQRLYGLWQVSGKCHLNFGTPWKPLASQDNTADIHNLTDELMDRIYVLVNQTRKETLCVSPTSLNPILP